MADDVEKIHITFSQDRIKVARSITSHKYDKLSKSIIELSAAKVFHKVLNRGRILEIFEKSDYEVLGSILFRIFTGHEQVKNFLLYNLTDIIRKKSFPCRVFLEFEDDILDMSALPWEYLMVEKNNEDYPAFFIAADRNKQFDFIRFYSNIESRHVDFNHDDRKEINVVLVVINNQDMPIGSNWQSAFKRLYTKNRVDGVDNISRFNYQYLENENFDTIVDDLKSIIDNIDGPYVLHFIGHAEMRGEDPLISLTGKDDNVEWIDAKTFADIFDDNFGIRLPSVVMLQACESGQLNSKGHGLGAALLKKGIPAVVAMQNEVTLDTSLAFMERIYASLLDGDDIGRAVTMGRHFLGCEFQKSKDKPDEYYNTNAFGTAVLYISTEKPIRLMPQKKILVAEQKVVMKKCTSCGTVYKNYKLDFCSKNGCRGKLEILAEDKAPVTNAITNASITAADNNAVDSPATSDQNILSSTTNTTDSSISSYAR